MKSISTFAITVSLAFAGALAASPASAQKAAPAAAPSETEIRISKGADKPIRALKAIVDAKDAAGYAAALAAAQAVATTNEDRYAIARQQLTHALNMKDAAGQIIAVEAMLASGSTRAADIPKLHSGLADLYAAAKNYDKAAASLEQLIALNPADAQHLWRLAQLRYDQKNYAEAVGVAERAITVASAAGQPVDLDSYRRILNYAYQGKLAPQTAKYARQLLAVSSDAKDRRNALLIFAQSTDLDAEGRLDLLRLRRSAGALADANDYYSLADALSLRNYYGEAQAVINEGIAAGKVQAGDARFKTILANSAAKIAEDKAVLPDLAVRAQNEAKGDLALRIANGYFGHGDYAKAAELYRMAAEKGVPDTELAEMRLGIALAMAGRKAEAETAFKSVTGQRAQLASYWMAWLSNQA